MSGLADVVGERTVGERISTRPAFPGRLVRPLVRPLVGLLVGLLVGHGLAPGPVLRYACYTCVALTAAVLMRRGIGAHRPSARGWRWLEAGLWLHAGYGTTLLAQALVSVAATRWPAAAEPSAALPTAEQAVDGLAHLAMVAAAVDFVAVRRPGQTRAGVLDAVTALLAVGLLAWQWQEHHGDPARLLDLGQAGTWIVAMLMVSALIVGGRLYVTAQRPPSFALLVTATVLALVGNLVMLARPTEAPTPRWVETLWLAGVVLAAVAAQLPGMRLLGEPEQAPDRGVSPWRVLALGAALLANPALVAIIGERGTVHALLLAAGVTVLTLLVLWRIGRLLGERAALQAQLLHQATHDALTGLPNRTALLDRLNRAFSGGRALLFVDLDGFKPVNDRLGHAAGDELLAAVAARINSCLRAGDVAARLGGDEFAVLLHHRNASVLPDTSQAAARRLLTVLSSPFALPAGTASITASIGIAYSNGTSPLPPGELVRHADAAMYAAKRAGKNTHRLAPTPPAAHGTTSGDPMRRTTA